MTSDEFGYILNSFRVFEGKETKSYCKRDLLNNADINHIRPENSMYLEEHNFVKNFSEVFETENPFFGKLLYLHMAKGFDKGKVSFLRYLEVLYPICSGENRMNHNKIVFNLLDLDLDGGLNILNLLTLQKNFFPKSKVGQEILSLIKYFIDNFLSKKDMTNNQRLTITYELFSKIVGRSCLVDQLRNTFFGCQPSVENVFNDQEGISQTSWNMFEGVNIIEDVSNGQRGFLRNQEGLLSLMQKHLERYQKPKGD